MKVAIVTGTSSGIGLHTTIELAKQQYNVIALMRRQSDEAALIEQLQTDSLIDQVEYIKLNMENVQEVLHTIEYILNKYKRIDLLVNNAGYAQGGIIELVDYDAWQTQFQANVWIAINLCKAVAPVMREQRFGKIINMGSISGKIGLPAYGPYAMSKFALAGFSEALRFELLPYNIFVILIEAGSYQTSIWNKGFSALPPLTVPDYKPLYERMVDLTKQSASTKRHPVDLAKLIAKLAKQRKPSLYQYPTIDIKLIAWLKHIVGWRLFEHLIMNYIIKLKKHS